MINLIENFYKIEGLKIEKILFGHLFFISKKNEG